MMGYIQFSVGKKQRMRILLNKHTIKLISGIGIKVRSFTITPDSLSLSFRKEVNYHVPRYFFGIDRNASNVTYGNSSRSIQFDLKKVEEIARSTRDSQIFQEEWREKEYSWKSMLPSWKIVACLRNTRPTKTRQNPTRDYSAYLAAAISVLS